MVSSRPVFKLTSFQSYTQRVQNDAAILIERSAQKRKLCERSWRMYFHKANESFCVNWIGNSSFSVTLHPIQLDRFHFQTSTPIPLHLHYSSPDFNSDYMPEILHFAGVKQ